MTPDLPDQVTHDSPQTASQLQTGRRLTGVLSIVTFLLLLALPYQTHTPKGTDPFELGWWSHPSLAPAVMLLIMLGCSLSLFRRFGREKAQEQGTAAGLLVPIEFSAYFVGFIFLMGLVGFGFSVLTFGTLAIWRTGFRFLQALGYAALLTVILVILFRIILTVWFPSSALSNFLPPHIGGFIDTYF